MTACLVKKDGVGILGKTIAQMTPMRIRTLIALKEVFMPKMKIILIVIGTMLMGGCVSVGTYKCSGIAIQAPIVPIGVQIGPCGLR